MRPELGFRPEEALFCPTARCNLRCGHCTSAKSEKSLPLGAALKFLSGCKSIGVKRVGFSGGEPFLAPGFLCAMTKRAVRLGLKFDRIMTNGVWFRDVRSLRATLSKLRDSGYDGSICVSVDAFHRQDLRKAACFIREAAGAWRRPDVVSIAAVRGASDRTTDAKLRKLARLLGGRLTVAGKKDAAIRCSDIFIRIYPIELSPVGRAGKLKRAWGPEWFKEDFCEGPGNVLFVQPDGNVKPCCGYSEGSKFLTVGNIKDDSPKAIMKNIRKNDFVAAIYGQGLSGIRRTLVGLGVKFPGRTTGHCYFCNYVMTKVPPGILAKCLNMLRAAMAALLILAHIPAVSAEETELTAAKDYRVLPGRIVKKIILPKGYHEGLFYDGKSIWVCNGKGLKTWVVDPDSGKILTELKPATGFTEAITRSAADSELYMTDWTDEKLYRVKLDGDRIIPGPDVSFSPAHPAGVIWADGRFFVITWTRGSLGTKFDILEMDASLSIKTKIAADSIQEPSQLAWDGKYLWVSSWYSKLIYKVDIRQRTIVAVVKSPVRRTTGIAWVEGYLWVTGTAGHLYKMEVKE